MPQYTLEIVTPPASEPVTTAELKTHLQLNTTAEDSLLADFITTARIRFETVTKRAVMPTTFRQWFYDFSAPITLIRGGVTAVSSLKYYDTDDTLQTVDTGDYDSDLTGLVPSVFMLDGYPSTSSNKSPVGYVQFVAGWANAGAVPAAVKTAIRILASAYFRNRAGDQPQKDVDSTFNAIASQYTTGLISYEG